MPTEELHRASHFLLLRRIVWIPVAIVKEIIKLRREVPALVVVLWFQIFDKLIHGLVEEKYALLLTDRVPHGITEHGRRHKATALTLHLFPPLVQVWLTRVQM